MSDSTDGAPSIVARVRDALSRIAQVNSSLNAFTAVFESEAIAQAQDLDTELRSGRSRGPLHGRLMSIKDLVDVKGWPTTAATRARAGHVAGDDATVIARLRDAGAVIIGKTNLHELALGTTSEESAFGPVRNPLDLNRSPGGSSGGSAAAVAAGLCWASIGTDTGGSIRIPSAACGVVGLKPTFGEVPTTGVVPLSVSLDHVGPIASNVADAWAVFSALTGTPFPRSQRSMEAVRLGRLTGYFLDKLDDDVRRSYEQALARMTAAGIVVVDVELLQVTDIARTYFNIVLPEAYAYYAKLLEENPSAFGDGVRSRLEMGAEISRDDYVKAQSDRGLLRSAVDAALKGVDAAVLPTLPIPAPRIGETTAIIDGKPEPLRPLMLRLTQLFNLTGHPAISVPCGRTTDDLPCGLQLVGHRHHTSELLSVALRCETHVNPHVPSLSSHQ